MSEISERYRTLAHRFTEVVDAVPDDRWDRPSPCPGWTAHDVFSHLVQTEIDFLRRVDLAPDTEVDPDDPRMSWPVVRDAVQAVLDDPERAATSYDGAFGPTTFETSIGMFYVLDLLVHAWDIARAAGLPEYETMPADEVTRVFADIRGLGDAIRQPTAFGPEIEIADTADEQSRFLAYLGRTP